MARSTRDLKPSASGELAGSTTAAQLPDVDCSYVIFQARADNAGNVYIGLTSSMTVGDGSTDTTTGFELDAGDVLGPIPTGGNLNKFYRRTNNAGDDITYLCFA